MKHKLVIVAIVLVIIIAGVAVYLYNSIDSIVQSAIERSGTEIMGTEVSVGSVHISLRSGRGTIRNVRVNNPEGFSGGDVVSLGEITIDLDVASLNRDPVVIQEIRVHTPVVNAEVDERLVTNVGVIRSHVQNYRISTAPTEPGKQDAGYEKHFVIRSFVMDKGVVSGDATRVGYQKRDYDLPPLELSNVGGSRGSRPDAIGKALAAAIFTRVAQVVNDQVREAAAERIKNKAGEILSR
jgi:hypothetical protein